MVKELHNYCLAALAVCSHTHAHTHTHLCITPQPTHYWLHMAHLPYTATLPSPLSVLGLSPLLPLRVWITPSFSHVCVCFCVRVSNLIRITSQSLKSTLLQLVTLWGQTGCVTERFIRLLTAWWKQERCQLLRYPDSDSRSDVRGLFFIPGCGCDVIQGWRKYLDPSFEKRLQYHDVKTHLVKGKHHLLLKIQKYYQ